MKIFFVYFLTLSTPLYSQALTAATVAPESDASALVTLIAGFKNSTLGIPIPPDEFHVTYSIGGPKLRITPCLMNTIAALKELALGDWDGKTRDGTEYRLDNYPEVSIIITSSKRRYSIQTRFVVWAICLGVFDMISKKKFEFAQFEMLWHEQVLGWVQVVNQPAGVGFTVEGTQSGNTLELGNKSTTLLGLKNATKLEPSNITNVVTMDNADDPAEARLDATFTYRGNNIGIYDVFVPIMSALTDMAQVSNTHQSGGLFVALEGFKGVICIFPAVPLRTRPPFLDNSWLIRTLARIPTYMLDNSRFGEVNISIAVDGAWVGFGRLGTMPDCYDTSLPVSIGVAES